MTAWIEIVDPDDGDQRLSELYAAMVDPESGTVDNILQLHSLHPEGLAAHWALYRAVMTPTATVSRRDREMIAVAVSAINDCHY